MRRECEVPDCPQYQQQGADRIYRAWLAQNESDLARVARCLAVDASVNLRNVDKIASWAVGLTHSRALVLARRAALR